jgi:hypothetical protein
MLAYDGGAARTGAGTRKPPMEETAAPYRANGLVLWHISEVPQ